ncbi:unnamed protein product [Laminaria digitata]
MSFITPTNHTPQAHRVRRRPKRPKGLTHPLTRTIPPSSASASPRSNTEPSRHPAEQRRVVPEPAKWKKRRPIIIISTESSIVGCCPPRVSADCCSGPTLVAAAAAAALARPGWIRGGRSRYSRGWAEPPATGARRTRVSLRRSTRTAGRCRSSKKNTNKVLMIATAMGYQRRKWQQQQQQQPRRQRWRCWWGRRKKKKQYS